MTIAKFLDRSFRSRRAKPFPARRTYPNPDEQHEILGSVLRKAAAEPARLRDSNIEELLASCKSSLNSNFVVVGPNDNRSACCHLISLQNHLRASKCMQNLVSLLASMSGDAGPIDEEVGGSTY
jgi:hypothetical protein